MEKPEVTKRIERKHIEELLAPYEFTGDDGDSKNDYDYAADDRNFDAAREDRLFGK